MYASDYDESWLDYRLETSCNEYHSEDYDYYTVVNKKQNFRV